MKFYVTCENQQKLKRSFLNLKMFSIIDIDEIMEEMGYTHYTVDTYAAFIINERINERIESQSKSKMVRGIIYSNSHVNPETIDNLYDTLEDNQNISKLVLMDDQNVPKVQHLYYMFDEIIFFPSVKKVRLIECQVISSDNIPWT